MSWIPNNKPYLIGTEIKNIQELFSVSSVESGGKFTKLCQSWLTEHLKCSAALLVSSGTAALDMIGILLELQAGDEVIIPSFTFVSTANAFVLRGAIPVFVDVRGDTLNIDETKIESSITPKTKAIVVVHYAGVACEMDTIMAIALKHNLIVVEDAAHAVCSYYKGIPLGSIGHYSAFSFHYTKNIICGEGGAVCLNHSTAEQIARAHIVWEKGTNRFEFLNGKIDKYAWIDIGSSFMPSEIQSAFLHAQLMESSRITDARVAVFQKYIEALRIFANIGLIQLPHIDENSKENGHIFFLLCQNEDIRGKLIDHLKLNQIQAFSHYVPLHSSIGGQRFGRTDSELTVTDSCARRIVRLPLWAGMGEEVVVRVIGAVVSFFQVFSGSDP